MARYLNTGRIGALAGVLAAASMAVTPAYAADMTPAAGTEYGSAVGVDFSQADPIGAAVLGAEADTADYHRRYRRYRHNRIDGGDVLAGVLILGGIAAIASAASNNDRRRYDDRRYDDRRYDQQRYDDRRPNPRASDSSGLDSAVSQCLAEIERDVRVESVDGASRGASGWIVSGTLYNGTGFSCQIDNSGRISNIDYGGYSGASFDAEARQAAGQWSDARYAEARAAAGEQSPDITRVSYAEPQDGAQPAYPGGPLPGEEGYPN